MTQQQQPTLITDLTLLPRDISSDEIADILRQRYLNDLIYTNISPSVLIVLNPYNNNNSNNTTNDNIKADYIAEYKDTSSAKANQWREPHLYQLVNHAYLHMRRTSINQSILFR
jgi:chitin synthase